MELRLAVNSAMMATMQLSEVAGYRVVRTLGEGGQGSVYLGVSPDGQHVAIKVLHATVARDEAARRRFLNEAGLMRRVAPFCTTRVLDVGFTSGVPYIVSEYVPGESLESLVAKQGPRRGSSLDRLAVATLTALQAIHQAGVVHRDFKPSNVLMGSEGPVVIDFGIAKALDAASTTTAIIGTPAFMSPEQITGRDIGPASDMFAWAATLVYAATGRSVFGRETTHSAIYAVMHEHDDLPDMPEPFRRMALDCLNKDWRARPGAGDLLRFLTGTPAPAPVGHTLPPPVPAPRRWLIPTVVAGVVVVGGAAVLLSVDRGGGPGGQPVNAVISLASGWRLTVTGLEVERDGVLLRIRYDNLENQTNSLVCSSSTGGSYLDFGDSRVAASSTFCSGRIGQNISVGARQSLDSWGRFPVAGMAGREFTVQWFDWISTGAKIKVPGG
ncbi:serine/threonine-protein kinase [Nonomuraea sp. NPDC050663]|uniref:serine/threonine-protein kinase n=1 Tax=Nonomuraea sp. NPDC050663 TaxID=3364370 RepID=UPI00378F130E